MGNDQEIEFQAIKIVIFQEIKTFCKIDEEIEKTLKARFGVRVRLSSRKNPDIMTP
jgi:hypothetical protein